MDERICPICRKAVERRDMTFTRDCHGIPVRLVCYDCYPEITTSGFDDSTVLYEDTDDPDCMVGW